MTRMNILLVEDDLDLGNGLRIALGDQGYGVAWVRTLASAHRALSERPDVVLLDLGLPDGDGLTLLTQLRGRGDALPVLMITARDALADCTRGLDTGADDYVVKPFALAELLSRIRAVARRAYPYTEGLLEVRGLRLSEANQRVTVSGNVVEVTRSEFQILLLLLKRADHVITRQAIEDRLWKTDQYCESNALEVHMSNIRRKIGEGYIRTVRGIGYVIDRAPGGRLA